MIDYNVGNKRGRKGKVICAYEVPKWNVYRNTILSHHQR